MRVGTGKKPSSLIQLSIEFAVGRSPATSTKNKRIGGLFFDDRLSSSGAVDDENNFELTFFFKFNSILCGLRLRSYTIPSPSSLFY